jgi:hypothetical protein
VSLRAETHASRWLPLIQRLSAAHPSWVIWKNADAALSGFGDIDSAAPRDCWDAIIREFRSWARQNGLGPVAVCRHPPLTMFLIALDRERSTFVELDVSGRKYFRGGTLFRAEDLSPLAEQDPRGFRSLRPGAQGLILLLGNGLRWGGRPNEGGLAHRRVSHLLAKDPAGVRLAAAAFGLPDRPAQRATEAVLAGTWNRGAALALELSAIRKALLEPGILLKRARFRLVSKRSCPILRSVFYANRLLSGNPDAWVRDVHRSHDVYSDRGPL